MTTDTLIEDVRWGRLDLPALADRASRAALVHLGLDPDLCEVTLLACDDARIADLNAEFRGKPTPTNVLSWPSEERSTNSDGAHPDLPVPDFTGTIALGDIAIAFDTCDREATAAGKPMTDHVTHLLVHGLLHLLGYDHERDRDATLMEGLETDILGSMGLDDPYKVD